MGSFHTPSNDCYYKPHPACNFGPPLPSSLYPMLPHTVPWLSPYPPVLGICSQTLTAFPVPQQYAHPLSTFHPYPQNAFVLPFNPHQPPPFVPPITAPVTSKPVSSNPPHLSRVRTCDSRGVQKSRKESSPRTKSADPVRFSKIVCVPATDYFDFESSTGCYCATQLLIDLEDRFETEVVARRRLITANDPERKPPERPATSDHEQQRFNSKSKRTSSICGHFNNNFNSDNSSTKSYGRSKKRSRISVSVKPNLQRHGDDKCNSLSHTDSIGSNKSLFDPMTPNTDDDPTDLASQNNNDIGGKIGQGRTMRQQLEVAYKLSHPNRLHPDIWHNEPNEFNDGPACSCKSKYRIGPLHNQYEGEQPIPHCRPESNNRDRLYHYRIMISPTTNFVHAKPTKIHYGGFDYIFDGFSMFVHYRLDNPPPCQILRFNILYDIYPVEEDFPEFFTVRSLDLITDYIFMELLELLDLVWKPINFSDSCNVIHLMPRFVLALDAKFSPSSSLSPSNEHNGSVSRNDSIVAEILPINVILEYLLGEALKPIINVLELSAIQRFSSTEWSSYIADLRGTLATFPGKKPAAIRIDQLDRQSVTGQPAESVLIYPLIVHMTYTPMKLSLTREPKYKCVLKNFMKLQYLMLNKPRISPTDRAQLAQLAHELEEMEHSGVHRREITVEISCEGFYRTGLRSDVSQYALNLVSLVAHLRFHKSLETLEARLGYTFKDKSLLHQALTHPSYRRTNFGLNQDHFQNSLTNCGPRLLEYGDKLQLYKAWRKKGLTKMIQIMSFLPNVNEERSNIYGNERLEFLGDAIIEVISSIHLFFMFPELSEGHLDAYRQAIVQNQHLAELAVRLGIHKFLLYTHSVDFCYDSTFIYARSDAFEALMAAIALDSDLETVDRIFGAVLFGDNEKIHRVWVRIPPHPLQAQCPEGDRLWAVRVPMLKKLCSLEDSLGIQFKHLRVLARAMTIRKTGFNFYTLGDNQRLEFLGDSLLKYVSTDYLFRHFPRHHEGHLSLLKNSLVNKYTQAAVCTELGLDQFVIRREDNSFGCNPNKSHLKESNSLPNGITVGSSNITGTGKSNSNTQNQNVKYRADLLEAFIGALFVDKDLTWVERFCQVCFWPRLVEFILKQEWNDAKSKLQQCCLTFRSLHEDPEIAHYKVLEHSGPTNQRTYRVGVYFRGQRLATGQGRSVQQAQMEAAKKALELHQDTFRQLDFQRSVISKRYKQPYIDKILDQVQNWDENLVDCFISDEKPTTTDLNEVALDTMEDKHPPVSTPISNHVSQNVCTSVVSSTESDNWIHKVESLSVNKDSVYEVNEVDTDRTDNIKCDNFADDDDEEEEGEIRDDSDELMSDDSSRTYND